MRLTAVDGLLSNFTLPVLPSKLLISPYPTSKKLDLLALNTTSHIVAYILDEDGIDTEENSNLAEAMCVQHCHKEQESIPQ